MIPNTHLRLGNIVQTSNGFPMRVTGIFSDVVYLDFEGNEGDVWEEKQDDLFPVEITDELLLKLGFKKDGKWYGCICLDIYRTEKGHFVARGVDVPLSGLHSLQNLYFAVRGRELIEGVDNINTLSEYLTKR